MHELDAIAAAVVFTEGMLIQNAMLSVGIFAGEFFYIWALLLSLLCVKALLSQPHE